MFKQQPLLGIQPGNGCLIFSEIYFGYKMKYTRVPDVLPPSLTPRRLPKGLPLFGHEKIPSVQQD
ncbi:hypothetical protein MF626_08075 [Paenibacillus polymyxa]|nr:hypothetical protein [Paenibacillus polymyxa]WDZ59756.1 hypothetical protein MF626_08075 [Paenibacillus polymyxa]